jgi:GTP-binding protein HflX
MNTVENTLEQLGITDKPVLKVFNKIDLLDEIEMVNVYRDKYPDSIFVSAYKNMNIERLLDRFQEMFDRTSNEFKIFLPYDKANLLQDLFALTEIVVQTDDDEGSFYEIKVQDENLFHFQNKFEDYLVNENE